jgi:hypothetical protein
MYESGLEGSRQRLDGHLGFRCYCGNSSILADEEKGLISVSPPTKEALYEVAERLSKRDNVVLPDLGSVTIDGFTKESV